MPNIPSYRDLGSTFPERTLSLTLLAGAFRILNIIDEFTRECLRAKVNRKISFQDVIDELFNLFIFRAIPEHIRSDNGPEFTAKAVRR